MCASGAGDRPDFREQAGTTTFVAKIQPNAPRCSTSFAEDGSLKLRIDAPPVDDAANERLVEYLAREVLGLPRSAVRVVQGAKGRNKTVAVDMPLEQVRQRLRDAALASGKKRRD